MNLYSDTKGIAQTSLNNVNALDHLGSNLSQVCFAAGKLAFEDNPEMLIHRLYKNYSLKQTGNKISESEFNEKYANFGLQHDANMTGEFAEYLLDLKQKRANYEYVISKGKSGFAQELAKFGTQIGVSFLSPINIATSLIPIFPGTFAKVGQRYGALAKAASQSATASITSQIALEPFLLSAYKSEQENYTLANSLANVGIAGAFGASIGGITHGVRAFKSKFFSNPYQLNQNYKGKSTYLNEEFKNQIDITASQTEPNISHLGEIDVSETWIKDAITLDHPTTLSKIEEQIRHIQSIKEKIIDEASKDAQVKDYFSKCEERAKVLETLHEKYQTGGNIDNIPEHLIKDLPEISNHSEIVQVVLQDLAEVDKVVQSRLNEMQHITKGYNVCEFKKYIARNQFDEGYHVNVDEPLKQESIYAKDIERFNEITKAEYIKNQNLEGAKIEDLISNLSSQDAKLMIQDLKLLEKDLLAAKHLPKVDSIKAIDVINAKKKEMLISAKSFCDNYNKIKEYKAPHIGLKDVLSKAELRKHTASVTLVNGFFYDLQKANLVDVFKNKAFANDIARELHNLTSHLYTKGFTGSSLALKVAEIIYEWQDKAVQRANLAGANIHLLPGYITRQTHNQTQIRKAGKEAWKSFIRPLLEGDIEEKTLNDIFDALATGLHDFNEDIASFGITSSIASKVSARRKLHFKDANSWLVYNERFGNYNLKDSIVLNLERIGQITGVMEILGPNPENTFNNLKNKILETCYIKSEDSTSLNTIKQVQKKSLSAELKLILGMDTPENPTMAAIASNARALINMATLGRTLLSSFADLGSWVVELTNNGIPIFKSYSIAFKNALSCLSNRAEKRAFANALDVWSENLLGGMYERLHAENIGTGMIHKAQNLFFKLNLMEFWDSALKKSMGLVLSNNLANYKTYNKVPNSLRQILAKHGIKQDNYHLTRYLVQEAQNTKTNYIIPDSANLPDSVISEYLTGKGIIPTVEAIERVKNEFTSNLKDYFRERTNIAVATPGSREQAMLNPFGTQRGTWLGEFTRFIMQFKSFPVAFITKPIKATTIDKIPISDYSGNLFDLKTLKQLTHPTRSGSLSQLITATTVLGGISLLSKRFCRKGTKAFSDAKKAFEGKQDFSEIFDTKLDTNFIKEAMLQGGGLGILGDFIISEYNRYGNTFTQSLMGPAALDVNNAAAIATHIKKGEFKKANKVAKQWAKTRIPFGNLFYAQMLGLDAKSLFN